MAVVSRLTITNARILTLAGAPAPRRGEAMAELGVVERGWVAIEKGAIERVESGDPSRPPQGEVLDAGGCICMPAFIDCHTHACWAGDRFDEFEMKLVGVSYLDILAGGGGIRSTVRAVREATEEELTAGLLRRLERMAALGSATVEVKSGYGLTTRDELKMLRAIHAASGQTPLHLVATFLGAHAIDVENPEFVEQTITETLPAVANEFPGIPCDAYCEKGAWTLEDTRRLFEQARDLGCPLRIHADQFNSLGATRLAVELGAVSVDHLEATTPADLKVLAESDTIGVALPASGFHLDGRYAPARDFLEAGGALAIATNCNPGSAPTPSIPFVISLACRALKLRPAEAITAVTVNAACVLGVAAQLGSIEPGKRADLQVLDCTDERELGFDIAGPGPRALIIDGAVVYERRVGPPEPRSRRV
jgi:imidazolonepropionase